MSAQTDTILFLSTPSARRATTSNGIGVRLTGISIHALREEGDYQLFGMGALIWAFLSTPSARRATHPSPPAFSSMKHFYPRPPRGGRPYSRSGPTSGREISIHALREEGDSPKRPEKWNVKIFLSTPSARRATFTKRSRT